MESYTFYLADSLEKVFPDRRPAALPDGCVLSALQGEVPAVQLVYHRCRTDAPQTPGRRFEVTVAGAPAPARLRGVALMPSDFPCYDRVDDNYLTTQPGLFPDMLAPLADGVLTPLAEQYRACWIDFPDLAAAQPGSYDVTVTVHAVADAAHPGAGETVLVATFALRLLPAALPAQTLLHTEWFHTDCLADFYRVPVFGEAHWALIEAFIAAAARDYRVNMLLTPVFTPPLDTAVGGERTTVQLVDITLDGGEYGFGFDKLARWCGLCRQYGITHLEIAHFFTQWGARATPKIMVVENGVEKRKFGWDVAATSAEYRRFLEAFVPALRAALAAFGYGPQAVYYHISDEPGAGQLADYKAARAQISDLLQGCNVADALSDYGYYSQGLVALPIPASDHIQPFIDNKVDDLWVYYCCGQSFEVPNRFFAMPSARNRIMGTLMYRYNIVGFLHWGYNFYNAQYSLRHIDPFYETHAGHAFPSGDPFLVYPGPDGRPVSSIRGEVLRAGLDDMRALQLLESLTSRGETEALIDRMAGYRMTFKHYPADSGFIVALREAVNAAIEERL